MARLLLLWGLLLLSGVFLVDSYEGLTSNTTTPAPSNNTTPAPANTTTPAPSNTTTPAPSNTTTPAPSNTTTPAPSNTTTPAPSNTTTHAPSNTTTPAPSNTTTHAPSDTTSSPLPTLPPKPSPPSTGNYSAQNGNDACILALMGLSLELDISKEKRYFNIDPMNTYSNGTCGETKANLVLSFHQGLINFVFAKENKMYYISEVSVIFTWEGTGHWNETVTNLNLLKTAVGYAVKCKNTPTIKLGGSVQLTMADVKLQAFEIQKKSFGKGKYINCIVNPDTERYYVIDSSDNYDYKILYLLSTHFHAAYLSPTASVGKITNYWCGISESICYPDSNKLLVPVGVSLAVVGLILIIILVFLLARRRRNAAYERL
ncbi:lysosome-associated membrane glycoprotein 3 [Gastrophryne carolinensis]